MSLLPANRCSTSLAFPEQACFRENKAGFVVSHHPKGLSKPPGTIAVHRETVYNNVACTRDFWRASKSLFAVPGIEQFQHT